MFFVLNPVNLKQIDLRIGREYIENVGINNRFI